MIIECYESVHFDHPGVEVGSALDLAGVVADAAHCNYVDEADQQGYQATDANYPPRTSHEILEGVVAILKIFIAF